MAQSNHRPDLFVFALNHLRTGAAREASDKLAELIEAVRFCNKQGTLTLTLKVKPEGDGIYGIEDDIKLKKPSLPRGKTILFGTPDNNLATSDQSQPDLPLKAVSDNEQNEQLKRVATN